MAQGSYKKISISKNDGLNDLIAALRREDGDKVEIFIPEGAKIFKSGLNFQILKEEARRLSKEIVIDTPDDWGQKTVIVSGLPLKEGVQEIYKPQLEEREDSARAPLSGDQRGLDIALKKAPVKKKMPSITRFTREKPDLKPRLDTLKNLKTTDFFSKKPKKPKVSLFKKTKGLFKFYERRPFSYKKLTFLFLAAAVAVAFLVVYFVLPSAQIIIEPRRVKTSVQARISADISVKEPNLLQAFIPAQLITAERILEKEYSASGKKEVREPARGTIAIYNAYSSDPQTLVAGTRFLSKEGKLFCLANKVTVPGAKVIAGGISPNFLEAEVYSGQFVGSKCVEAFGEEFNIGPSEFVIPGFQNSPKFNGFYGVSDSVMSGGAEGLATVISEEDLSRAKEAFDKEIFDGLQKDLISRIPENLIYISDSIVNRKSEEEFSHQVGGAVSRFKIKARASVAVLAFSPEHLELIFSDRLSSQVSEQQFIENTGEFEFKDVAANIDEGELKFTVQGERVITSKIDKAVLLEKLLGKNESEIREILIGEPSVEAARLKLVPFWLKEVPSEINKVEIIVK